MSDKQTSRAAFIASYVARCRAAGFEIEATEDGCIYAADPDWDESEIRMTAVPCTCEGHDEGWHMEEADSGQARIPLGCADEAPMRASLLREVKAAGGCVDRMKRMGGAATRPGLYKCYACRKQSRVTVGGHPLGGRLYVRRTIASFDLPLAAALRKRGGRLS